MSSNSNTFLEQAKLHYEAGRGIIAMKNKEPQMSAKKLDRDTLYHKSCCIFTKGAQNVQLALVTGEANGLTVVDIDCKDKRASDNMSGLDVWNEVVEKNGGLQDAVCAKTPSGGKHYLFKHTPLLQHGQKKCFKHKGEWCDIDVRNKETCGFICCYPSAGYEWVRSPFDHELTECPQWIVDWHTQSKAKKEPKEKTSKKNKDAPVAFELLQEVVTHLSARRMEDYDNWYPVVGIIGRLGVKFGYETQARDLAHSVSQQCPGKYDRAAVDKIFDGFKDTPEGQLGFGTLVHFLSEDDPQTYKRLFGGDKPSYAEVKAEFEKRHFKIMSPFCFVRESEWGINMFTRDKLKDAYENLYHWQWVPKEGLKQQHFIFTWLGDENLRCYEKMDFLPPPKACPDNVYNLYKGLRAEKLPPVVADEAAEGLSAVLTHVNRMVGGDDRSYEYVLRWLAQRVQAPGQLPLVALIFKSDQGTGKNLFCDFFGKQVLGSEYYYLTPRIESFVGHFAEGLKHRLCVVLDETSGKDTFSANEKLKNNITSELVEYEHKGVQSVSLTNCAGWLFLTNNNVPVKIESTDRRFCVFEGLNDRLNDQTYFKPLVDHLSQDKVARAFYDYLRAIDLTGFSLTMDRPLTEAYQAIKACTAPPCVRFLRDYIDEMEAGENIVPPQTLFADYQMWLLRTNTKSDMNNNSFSQEIRKYLNNTKQELAKVRKNNQRFTIVNKNKVIESFKAKKYYFDDYF